MSLDAVINELSGYEQGITEQRVTERLVLSDNQTLLAGDSSYRLGAEGIASLCNQVSAPVNYVMTLDGDIRNVLLQGHLDRGDLEQDNLTLIARDGELLGFGRADLARIGVADVLHGVQDGANHELNVHSIQFSQQSVQADLLLQQIGEEVAPGDVLQAGVRVTHSFIGSHATWIEAFILRLVCRNGLTHRECAGKRATRTRRLPASHQAARQLQIEQVRRLSGETVAKLREKLNTIRGLQRETVDVDQMFGRWLDRVRLSTREWLPTLQRAWQEEGSQPTAYGVMNALTRVATHENGLSLRQRRLLSGLAGLLAFQRLHLCPRCFSQLGGAREAPVGQAV